MRGTDSPQMAEPMPPGPSVRTPEAPDSWPTVPWALQPQGSSSPASLLLLHILDNGTLGESQLILSLGLVVKEGFDRTLQRTGTTWGRQSLPATLLTWGSCKHRLPSRGKTAGGATVSHPPRPHPHHWPRRGSRADVERRRPLPWATGRTCPQE